MEYDPVVLMQVLDKPAQFRAENPPERQGVRPDRMDLEPAAP
jgi:hypothetical protein